MQIASVLLVLEIAVNSTSLGAEYHIDFRDGKFDNRQLQLIGSGSSPLVKPGPSGLLTKAPATIVMNDVGFAAKFTMRGDFEITVSYEILDLAKPGTGYGVGPGIHVVTASKSEHSATLSRRKRVKEGDVYAAHAAWSPDAGSGAKERMQRVRLFNTKVESGKLRLVRSGKVLHYLVADEDSEVFRDLYHLDFTDADVEAIRVSINRGGAQSAAQVLWKDFTLRAEEISDVKPRSAGRGLLVLAIVALVGGLGGLGTWYRRRGRSY